MWPLTKCKTDNPPGEHDCSGHLSPWSTWVVLWDPKKTKEEREKPRRNNDMKIDPSPARLFVVFTQADPLPKLTDLMGPLAFLCG